MFSIISNTNQEFAVAYTTSQFSVLTDFFNSSLFIEYNLQNNGILLPD